MTDYTKQMLCETASDTDFSEKQSRRASALNAINPTSPAERSFLRQKTNLNNLRERVEKELRFSSKLDPDPAIGGEKFDLANKDKTLQNLRAILGEIKRQEE